MQPSGRIHWWRRMNSTRNCRCIEHKVGPAIVPAVGSGVKEKLVGRLALAQEPCSRQAELLSTSGPSYVALLMFFPELSLYTIADIDDATRSSNSPFSLHPITYPPFLRSQTPPFSSSRSPQVPDTIPLFHTLPLIHIAIPPKQPLDPPSGSLLHRLGQPGPGRRYSC